MNHTQVLWVSGLLCSGLLACTGIVDGERAPGHSQGPGSVAGPGQSSNNGTPGQTDATPTAPSKFKVPAQFPVLLPFDVRVARLMSVVGLPYTDAAFDLLRQNATQLGDYDYANGLEPDNTWTAFKMSLWVQSLKPVCAAPAMQALYPSHPESFGDLIEAAYGREATDQDTADFTAALGSLPVLPESRTQTTCLAVLSSLEFLAQ